MVSHRHERTPRGDETWYRLDLSPLIVIDRSNDDDPKGVEEMPSNNVVPTILQWFRLTRFRRRGTSLFRNTPARQARLRTPLMDVR
jgi:hypothetical protein